MRDPLITTWRGASLALLLSGLALQAHAITITPTAAYYEPGGVRYNFSVSHWVEGTGGPSPCVSDDPQVTTCIFELGVRIFSGSAVTAGRVVYRWKVPIRRGYASMKVLLEDLNRLGFYIPFSGSILVPTESVNPRLCIGFSWAHIGPNLGGAHNPFDRCVPVMKPVLQCEINGDTTINHNSLADNALDGATATAQLGVTCAGPSSVTVSTSRTDAFGVMLRNDGSLYSNVTVNGKDANAGINVPVVQGIFTPLQIMSTLNTRGRVTPGEFMGSTVVTVSPP